MRKLTIVTVPNCIYCKKANNLLKRICAKKHEYEDIEIEKITDREAIKRGLQILVFPTFYMGNEKVLEGYITIDQLTEVMNRAYTEAEPAE